MTTLGHNPGCPSGPDDNAGPDGTFRTRTSRPTLPIRLIGDHAALVTRGAGQVIIMLALVATGLWRSFATALNAFPAGLGVNFSYRPDRSIPTPAYEPLRAIGYIREGLAGASRGVTGLTGPHQRAAFRVDGYLLARRSLNGDAIGEELIG